uniref:Uncharacterized protein n=1 Tax=Glycine max TaxID=3847 RepID=A0A0R0KM79_SOYBN
MDVVMKVQVQYQSKLYRPKIQKFVSTLNLTTQDRPNIVTRIFKLNLKQLMSDLKDKKLLGDVLAFEIPDAIEQPQLYECVKNHMMHGLYGHANRKLLCMKDEKCFLDVFQKKLPAEIVVDQDGYLVYRRHNDEKYIEKNHVALDNRYVVSYNPNLLKYQAHLNIEWCNQSTSIKYLFKYINKGYDRITIVLVHVQNDDGTTMQCLDELKHYVDGRYISPCEEVCWIIFSFQLHKRSPIVERLYFHLPSENSIIFEDDDDIDVLLSKPTIKESMFTTWLKLIKQGYTIGRLNWVSPSTRELYYLRMMLVVVKVPTSYEEIHTVNGQLYHSFREDCFAMSFLNDDKEYIGALR